MKDDGLSELGGNTVTRRIGDFSLGYFLEEFLEGGSGACE